MKRLLAMVLSLGMMLSLAACGGGEDTPNEGTAGTDTKILYHAHHTAPYVTLDPSTEYSNGLMTLQNVYETLTRYNSETGEVDPLLATEWTKNEDGTVWVFQLREDVTFHDGS